MGSLKDEVRTKTQEVDFIKFELQLSNASMKLEKAERIKAEEIIKALQEKLKASEAYTHELEAAEVQQTSAKDLPLDDEVIHRMIRKYQASDEFQADISAELAGANQQGKNSILRAAAKDDVEEEVLKDWLCTNTLEFLFCDLHLLIPLNRDENLEARQLDRAEGRKPWVAPEIDPHSTLEYQVYWECSYVHLSEAQIQELEGNVVANLVEVTSEAEEVDQQPLPEIQLTVEDYGDLQNEINLSTNPMDLKGFLDDVPLDDENPSSPQYTMLRT